jgi:SNF2 family DNA or RNA helicase
MQLINCLHKILRPVMLRRCKDDLATKLPDKIEMNVSI